MQVFLQILMITLLGSPGSFGGRYGVLFFLEGAWSKDTATMIRDIISDWLNGLKT